MILAIDPGKSGAIAYYVKHKPDGWQTENVVKIPTTEQETIAIIQELAEICPNEDKIVCYLEKVHAMPGQGVTSMFTFGHGYGFLRGVIQTLGIPLIDVTPQKWQGKLGLLRKSKDEIHQYVRQRYPDLKIPKYAADAVAILEYAKEITK